MLTVVHVVKPTRVIDAVVRTRGVVLADIPVADLPLHQNVLCRVLDARRDGPVDL